MVLRDRDTNGGGGWTGASDGSLNARHYYAQPPRWRADVSGIFDHTGAVLEWVKYSAYGVPHLLTPGDHDKSGEVDKDDETAFNADYGTGNVRADLDEDGDVDTDDQTLFTASFNKTTPGGRWKLSAEDVGNRKGYAGYEHEGFGNDLAAVEVAHVRHRVLHFGLGRWTRRDPMGYVDGANLYSASGNQSFTDPAGTWIIPLIPIVVVPIACSLAINACLDDVEMAAELCRATCFTTFRLYSPRYWRCINCCSDHSNREKFGCRVSCGQQGLGPAAFVICPSPLAPYPTTPPPPATHPAPYRPRPGDQPIDALTCAYFAGALCPCGNNGPDPEPDILNPDPRDPCLCHVKYSEALARCGSQCSSWAASTCCRCKAWERYTLCNQTCTTPIGNPPVRPAPITPRPPGMPAIGRPGLQ